MREEWGRTGEEGQDLYLVIITDLIICVFSNDAVQHGGNKSPQ